MSVVADAIVDGADRATPAHALRARPLGARSRPRSPSAAGARWTRCCDRLDRDGLLNNRDDCGTITGMSRLQVLLAVALLRHDRHRPGARPGRALARGRRRGADPRRRRAARRSSRCSPSGLRGLPRRPLILAALAVAAYQLSFFAAVADTGVAVGTIVALGSGARAGRRDRVGGRAPRAHARLGDGHRARVRRRGDARADRRGRVDLAPRRRASRWSPARPTRATRSPPSGCSTPATRPRP